jgi:iron complex outermembrane recepter protein
MHRLWAASVWLCIIVARTALAGAAPPAANTELETLTVTATRIERAAFEVPASISSVDIRRDTLGVNLSESLASVSGLLARDRQNYAQDTQIAIRGFGARSTFGIRGVRLYIDGIPATQPDGQGQVSHFNLASAERVEVLRGPFSALYGNSSGGVIQLFTADGAGAPSVRAQVTGASADTGQATLSSRGAVGDWRYNAGYMHFRTDGARGHSAAQRDSAQLKLGTELGTQGRLTLLYNDLRAPDAQDPLGLTRAQLDADPLQTAPTSLQFNTRKSTSQQQGGLIYDVDQGQQHWHMLGYTGRRQVEQYLAVPVSAQTDARSAGGVVDLGTQYRGGELRWSRARLVLGLSYDTLAQHRQGFENFVGSALGVKGALRRDERNDVSAFDQYLQFSQPLGQRWSLDAGVRHSTVQVESADFYIRPGNGDDSGRVDYHATTPVAGLLWRWRPTLNLYASYGEGYETPTLVELAYRSDGNTGLNLQLRSATSRNVELGWKWRPAAGLNVDAAGFRADSRNELSVVSNVGGRAAYGNIGATRREGFELAAQAPLGDAMRLEFAATALRARLAGGARIPGVPDRHAYLAWRWQQASTWDAAVEAHYVGDVMANDANTAAAAGYISFDLSLGHRWRWDDSALRAGLRVENLADRRYVGSLIVNEANARYFEPAAGRTIMASVALTWR